MNNSVIRPAEPGDYRVIINSVDEWWGGRQMMQMLPKLFFVHFRSTSFVAQNDGLIVGFVIGFISQSFGNEGYIHFLGVHPDFRRSGLGRVLYGRVFESMIDRGCSLVRCVTSPLNKRSIAFHLRMGFKPEESEKSSTEFPYSIRTTDRRRTECCSRRLSSSRSGIYRLRSLLHSPQLRPR